jgi:hypothetical protein
VSLDACMWVADLGGRELSGAYCKYLATLHYLAERVGPTSVGFRFLDPPQRV